jgi:hypothetical protein
VFDIPVSDAVAHLCGLQAQEPFVGLWSRMRAFDPAALSDLLTRRQVVRTHLMRRTVHLLTAEDVLAWRGRHDPMPRQRVLGGIDLDELATAGRAVMSDGEPRTMTELVTALADRWPATRPRGELLVAALVPVVPCWSTAGSPRPGPSTARWSSLRSAACPARTARWSPRRGGASRRSSPTT